MIYIVIQQLLKLIFLIVHTSFFLEAFTICVVRTKKQPLQLHLFYIKYSNGTQLKIVECLVHN